MRYIFHSLLRTGLSLGIMLTLILYASGFYPLALISQRAGLDQLQKLQKR